jgi:hypothetical protein
MFPSKAPLDLLRVSLSDYGTKNTTKRIELQGFLKRRPNGYFSAFSTRFTAGKARSPLVTGSFSSPCWAMFT